MTEQARPYTPTALPSVTARLLAFLAILLGGLCGGLIGWSVIDLQCGGDERRVTVGVPGATPEATAPEPADGGSSDDGGCTTWSGLGAVVGALIGAGGVGVVAVLVLRAMAEWRRELDVDGAGAAPPEP
jgi:hypothetical protein